MCSERSRSKSVMLASDAALLLDAWERALRKERTWAYERPAIEGAKGDIGSGAEEAGWGREAGVLEWGGGAFRPDASAADAPEEAAEGVRC